MLISVKCPKCGSEGGFSVVGGAFKGPFRCWKCKAIFNIEISNNQVISCAPLTVDQQLIFDKQQEAKQKKSSF